MTKAEKTMFLSVLATPIAREGWPFIAVFGIATFILFIFSTVLGWVGVILTLWCIYFFRNPDRVTPQRAGLIISPADGIVQMITEVSPPVQLDMAASEVTRISVFMNVFDCHVNRTPCAGKIEEILYKPGKFVNASLDKASEDNERNYYKIKDSHGNDIIVVQIAGLVARRIVCESSKDQDLKQGDRIGMIRFGSRADVYYENYEPLVQISQTSIAGETLLAKK